MMVCNSCTQKDTNQSGNPHKHCGTNDILYMISYVISIIFARHIIEQKISGLYSD
jgi:hypothetical protein